MDAGQIQAMLAEDRAEWDALCAALDARPEGSLHDRESPEWTARDVYTHLAAMMEGSLRQMEEKLAGRPVTTLWQGSEDEVNGRIREEYGRMSFDEARVWAQQAFDRLHEAIAAVPLDRWDAELEFYARADGGEHYRGHRGYITA